MLLIQISFHKTIECLIVLRHILLSDDIYESEKTTMNSQGVQVESLGGGQIVHDPRSRTITIGGMSHVSTQVHRVAQRLCSFENSTNPVPSTARDNDAAIRRIV